MTHSEAIEELKELLSWYLEEEGDGSETYHKSSAVRMAINELAKADADQEALEQQRQKAKEEMSQIAYDLKLSAIMLADRIKNI